MPNWLPARKAQLLIVEPWAAVRSTPDAAGEARLVGGSRCDPVPAGVGAAHPSQTQDVRVDVGTDRSPPVAGEGRTDQGHRAAGLQGDAVVGAVRDRGVLDRGTG